MLACYTLVRHRFAGRLSDENRQDVPCGFVSISTSGLSPTLWFFYSAHVHYKTTRCTLSVFF